MEYKNEIKRLEELTQLNAVPGQENEVAKYLLEQFKAWNLDIITDNLGSIYALKKSRHPNAKKVVIAGHMDEVGFMVIGVTDLGLVKVKNLGGITETYLSAQRVKLKTRSGTYLYGTIDAIAPHLLKEGGGSSLSLDDFNFDFGFRNREEALAAGVYIGAMVIVIGEFLVLNQGRRLLSKAFDNRYGVALGLEVLENLLKEDLPFDLYVGATVQEEVGTRGAQTSGYLINPDFVIVPDCSPARDTLPKKDSGALGQGVLIRYIDGSQIGVSNLLAFQEKMVTEAGVKYQYFQSPGSTDGGTFQKVRRGVLTLTHCICARSIHTNSSIIDIEDFIAAKVSLIYLIKNLSPELITHWQQGEHN